MTKTHVLAPHQRFTVNIADEDPTLASAAIATSVASTLPVIVERSQDEEFGTVISSTQPIMVERSMYSDANGVVWAAGTNVTGIRMP